MTVVLLYILAYFLGGVPFGYLIAKSKGIDLTKVGSGNIGSTNVLRVLGPKAGVLAFLLDVGKGALPPLLAHSLLPRYMGAVAVANHAVLVGVMAVLGHAFSPFLRFRGGKSVATSLGALLGTDPIVGLAGFLAFLVVYVTTQYVSLGSLLGSVAVLTAAVLTHETPLFIVVYAAVALFVIVRHKGNIQRLLKGQEPKTPWKRKPPDEPPEGGT